MAEVGGSRLPAPSLREPPKRPVGRCEAGAPWVRAAPSRPRSRRKLSKRAPHGEQRLVFYEFPFSLSVLACGAAAK